MRGPEPPDWVKWYRLASLDIRRENPELCGRGEKVALLHTTIRARAQRMADDFRDSEREKRSAEMQAKKKPSADCSEGREGGEV